ncbi:uncharacterized protein TNCV_4959041 [Trichonephila clavipes]|uniref:Secreted protein n=1 Tax=Trichonephila clavipes TaxID=2585209 RepID=A0A8X6VI28_TRICX|nr:uncharacterized protein TNCV_4959041 [Trichonephila clavipes]
MGRIFLLSWCGVVVRRRGASSDVVHVTYTWIKTTWSIAKSARVAVMEIGCRVGRNQTTEMRICDCWMQEGTTDRRGRLHPPQCTTSREDRQIVRMAQRGLSARSPLLGLPLTQNHGSRTTESANGVMKEGCGRQNGIKLSLLTNHAFVCKTTMVGFESRDTVERGCLTAAL